MIIAFLCIFFPILHFKAFFFVHFFGQQECTWHLWQYWEMRISTTKTTEVLSRRKTNPLAQKLSSPKWAARGFETVWEPKKWQAVAVVVVPSLKLQILDVRLSNFTNDTAYNMSNMFQVFILTLFQIFLWKSTLKGKKIPWILSAFKGPRWRSINLRRCQRSWPWVPLHPNWQADCIMVGKLIKIVKNLGRIAKALVTFWYVLGNVYKKLWLVTLMI